MAYDRARRFPKLITQTPPTIGPGTYDVSELPQPKRHLGKTGGVSIDFTEVRFKDKIPEGPGPVDYDVATDLLKPQKIRSHPGTWRGPAGKETNTTTLMYKGNFWSRMTGRTEPRPFLTPGPGDYEHETKMTATQVHDETNFPAPNSYDVKGNFDKYHSVPCKCDPYALEPVPFGQTSKRFDYGSQPDVPGPGMYDPRVQVKCTGSIYQAPFGTCASRFRKVSEDTGPGPSDYHLNVGNLAYESQERYRYTCTRPVQPEVYLDEISMYKEGDYESECSEEEMEEQRSNVYHAAFRSRTERFPRIGKTAPDPGAYEVLTAFKANRDKCDFLCPRMAAPFGTRSVRRLQIARDDKDLPDPTYYDVSGDISENAKGGVIPRSRPIDDTPVTPAPDRYCIHPYLSSSVVKKSFNVSLGKPKAIAELEEQEKQNKGARCPCTRKKLRWFSPSVQEYKCHTFSI
ncbi:PREDICTED: sperm-tail PG-rich repeat-containing protein 2-like [Eufriesea mexicana]|uniref:sperm-tail PG-rich repeat-containing protein 2-like n=1 Tax=Eufriesea mexicana TaxID=516756 RepID=UPI00083C6CB1|nr:PREDICTED: sperm-tail PG-rich repeat-containing protein 2-like [Eufriesea mexicana]